MAHDPERHAELEYAPGMTGEVDVTAGAADLKLDPRQYGGDEQAALKALRDPKGEIDLVEAAMKDLDAERRQRDLNIEVYGTQYVELNAPAEHQFSFADNQPIDDKHPNSMRWDNSDEGTNSLTAGFKLLQRFYSQPDYDGNNTATVIGVKSKNHVLACQERKRMVQGAMRITANRGFPPPIIKIKHQGRVFTAREFLAQHPAEHDFPALVTAIAAREVYENDPSIQNLAIFDPEANKQLDPFDRPTQRAQYYTAVANALATRPYELHQSRLMRSDTTETRTLTAKEQSQALQSLVRSMPVPHIADLYEAQAMDNPTIPSEHLERLISAAEERGYSGAQLKLKHGQLETELPTVKLPSWCIGDKSFETQRKVNQGALIQLSERMRVSIHTLAAGRGGAGFDRDRFNATIKRMVGQLHRRGLSRDQIKEFLRNPQPPEQSKDNPNREARIEFAAQMREAGLVADPRATAEQILSKAGMDAVQAAALANVTAIEGLIDEATPSRPRAAAAAVGQVFSSADTTPTVGDMTRTRQAVEDEATRTYAARPGPIPEQDRRARQQARMETKAMLAAGVSGNRREVAQRALVTARAQAGGAEPSPDRVQEIARKVAGMGNLISAARGEARSAVRRNGDVKLKSYSSFRDRVTRALNDPKPRQGATVPVSESATRGELRQIAMDDVQADMIETRDALYERALEGVERPNAEQQQNARLMAEMQTYALFTDHSDDVDAVTYGQMQNLLQEVTPSAVTAVESVAAGMEEAVQRISEPPRAAAAGGRRAERERDIISSPQLQSEELQRRMAPPTGHMRGVAGYTASGEDTARGTTPGFTQADKLSDLRAMMAVIDNNAVQDDRMAAAVDEASPSAAPAPAPEAGRGGAHLA